jgi:hypothetical protein
LPADVSNGADPQAQLSLVAELPGDWPAAVFWIGNKELTAAKLWRHLRTLNMVLIPKEYDAEDKPPPNESDQTNEAKALSQISACSGASGKKSISPASAT